MTLALGLFILFAVLQVADAYVTVRALALPGKREANPIMAWFMDKLGVVPALILTKVVVVAGVFYFLDSTPLAALWLLNALYVAVTLRNWKILKG